VETLAIIPALFALTTLTLGATALAVVGLALRIYAAFTA
jgi:hypothetical protein